MSNVFDKYNNTKNKWLCQYNKATNKKYFYAKIIYTIEKQARETEQIEEITERTMPVWLIFMGVPRNFDKTQRTTEKKAQKREQTQSANRGMFII